jgi:[acyl-carrier-protein] S-malonyltransferase
LATPDFVAGHSLGEYSALVAAGVLDFADAVRIVRKRGTYMQDAVPMGIGAMAAILGLDVATVNAGCEEAAQGEICSPANINSPSQIVIAGDSAAVDRACDILKEKGAKRAIRLNVSAPFHCALMMPAQAKLADDLGGLNYAAFEFPIFHNVDAGENSDPAVVAGKLTSQVSSSVRWLASVENMMGAGVDRFIEIGPGKVLTGLVRQISRDVTYANIENSESLKEALQ